MNFNLVPKLSRIIVAALEFMEEKCAAYLAGDPQRHHLRQEPEFLKRVRTVTLGFGMGSNITATVTLMNPDGLVVIGGTDSQNSTFASSLHSLSDGRIKLVDKLALRSTFYPVKIQRVVLFHDQSGLNLEEFFHWVAEQPHDETIEIIIFSM